MHYNSSHLLPSYKSIENKSESLHNQNNFTDKPKHINFLGKDFQQTPFERNSFYCKINVKWFSGCYLITEFHIPIFEKELAVLPATAVTWELRFGLFGADTITIRYCFNQVALLESEPNAEVEKAALLSKGYKVLADLPFSNYPLTSRMWICPEDIRYLFG